MENKTICLVDDEDVFHWIVRENLKKMEGAYDFISFYNGDEILEYLSESGNTIPDILLLDLNMPICGGWKFLDSFKEMSPEFKNGITIYIVSSSIDPKDQDRANEYSEVSAFVSKPITRDFLERILGSSLSEIN
ncbi:MAG: response regulator [Cyclobacteriaceae bacterium]